MEPSLGSVYVRIRSSNILKMDMEFALKSLREKYIKLSNEKTDGYKRNKVPKRVSLGLIEKNKRLTI